MKSLFKASLIALAFLFFTSSIGFTAAPYNTFKTVIYTGTGSEQSITGLGFQPDFVWIKNRNNIYDHYQFDSVRGATKGIFSNLTNSEYDYAGVSHVASLDEDGFTINGSSSGSNNPGTSYVAWCWKAGDEIVSNTDGSITSTVSANPDAGFSIVKYAGNGVSGATIGHGLGEKPSIIFYKNLTSTGTVWRVYSSLIGATQALTLNATNTSNATNDFNNTEPTQTVLSVGQYAETNRNYGSGENYIAYCWAEVPGVSSFGSYPGDGIDGNGPVVNCGFQVAYLMYKRTDAAGSWHILDNKRDTDNPISAAVYADLPNVEYSGATEHVDFTATGFQIKTVGAGEANASGGTYIYMAFSEADVVPSPPEIVSFTANKDEYDPDTGEPVILTWNVTNADAGSISISPGFTDLPPEGSVEVYPSSMTNYVLSATGLGTTVTQELQINVASGYKFTGDFTVDGKIGVGVLEPIYTLEVNGTIKAKEIIVTMDGWADYVFDDKYNLRSLDEVEKFIKKNKHLPEMKPGNTIEQDGLSVNEVLKIQQQKIEELTLYMIALKKENESLKIKTENKQLINRISLIEQALSKIKH